METRYIPGKGRRLPGGGGFFRPGDMPDFQRPAKKAKGVKIDTGKDVNVYKVTTTKGTVTVAGTSTHALNEALRELGGVLVSGGLVKTGEVKVYGAKTTKEASKAVNEKLSTGEVKPTGEVAKEEGQELEPIGIIRDEEGQWRSCPSGVCPCNIQVKVYEFKTEKGTFRIEAVDADQAKRLIEEYHGAEKFYSGGRVIEEKTFTPQEAYEKIQNAASTNQTRAAEAMITYGTALGAGYALPSDSIPVYLGTGIGMGFLTPEMAEGIKTLPFYDKEGKGTEQDKLSHACQEFQSLVTIELPNGDKVLKRSVKAVDGSILVLGWEDIPESYRKIAETEGVDVMYIKLNVDVKEAKRIREEAEAKLEDYKTEYIEDGETKVGYNLLLARAEGVTLDEMRVVGFDEDAIKYAEEAHGESQKTGVALPGDWSRVVMFDRSTGTLLPSVEQKKISNSEFQSLIVAWETKAKKELAGADWEIYLKGKSNLGDIGWTARGIVHNIEDKVGLHPGNYAIISSEAANRIAIQGAAMLFFVPTKAALPEYTLRDITPLEWAIGGAQIAAWTLPVIPKQVMPFVSAGVGGIFGYATAQNWDKLSTGQKVLAVAGTTLVSLPALMTIGRTMGPVAVKVPGRQGIEITVWRGIQVNGKPIIGISKSKPVLGTWGIKRPTLAQIKAMWHPVTKIETTLLGTEKALRKMGVSEADIAKIKTVWKEGVPVFVRQRPPTKVEPMEMLSGSQRLTPQEVAAVLKVSVGKWAKKIKMIYGSSTMRPQLRKIFRDWRKWHDIDIQTNMTATEVSQYTKDIIKELNRLGARARVNPEHAGMVEKWVGNKWVKVVDIHAEGITPDSPITQWETGAYGYAYAEAPVKIKLPGVGKLQIMTLSETGLRKAGSITRFQVTTVSPVSYRINDIADFYIIVANYKGIALAEKVAKAFGYTGQQLLEVSAKNPHRWALWSFSPSAAIKGLPAVAISIPASLAASIPASVSAELRSYQPIASLAASNYIMRASPYVVRSVSPSGKLSPNLIVSPSVKPSPKVSPSISASAIKSSSVISSISPRPYPSPYPSPKPRVYPSPAPSPVSPSPYPSPYPYPYPYAPPSPRPPPRLVIVKGKKYYKIPKGSIAWKQGIFWRYLESPWTQGKPGVLKYPPKGAVNIGERTPEQTIQMIGKPKAKVPKDASIDLGVVDIRISNYGKVITYTGKGLETVAGMSIAEASKGMSIPATAPVAVSKIRGKATDYKKLAFGTSIQSLMEESYQECIPKKFARRALTNKLGKMSAKEIAQELKTSKVSKIRKNEILKMLPDSVRREVELWLSVEVEYAPTRGFPKATYLPTPFRRKKKKAKKVVKELEASASVVRV